MISVRAMFPFFPHLPIITCHCWVRSLIFLYIFTPLEIRLITFDWAVVPGVQEVRYTHTAPGLSVSSVVWIASWVQFGGRLWMGGLGAGKNLSPFWDISCLLFLVMCHFYQVAAKWVFAFLWNVLRNRAFGIGSVFLCVSLIQWLHTSC